jgi:16S rRNA (cytidine1402-2'-O)-methyltransferase
VVVGGAQPRATDAGDAVAEVGELTAGGMKLKPAVAVVAERHGLSRNALYEATLAARRQPAG